MDVPREQLEQNRPSMPSGTQASTDGDQMLGVARDKLAAALRAFSAAQSSLPGLQAALAAGRAFPEDDLVELERVRSAVADAAAALGLDPDLATLAELEARLASWETSVGLRRALGRLARATGPAAAAAELAKLSPEATRLASAPSWSRDEESRAQVLAHLVELADAASTNGDDERILALDVELRHSLGPEAVPVVLAAARGRLALPAQPAVAAGGERPPGGGRPPQSSAPASTPAPPSPAAPASSAPPPSTPAPASRAAPPSTPALPSPDRQRRAGASDAGRAADPNRWAALALLGTAQLMVVLDATIVNIALPSAQKALHFSTADREWIVTAYALAFGSLLLLGGKLGDLFGRKWTFIAGLSGFAIVSAIGGLAQNFDTLVAARALQGMFGALLAPSALGLLTVTFAGSPDRAKAFGIFGAIAGGGASVGLVLGGALTQFLSWRWCLYVNLVIAVPTAIFALRLLVNHSDPERAHIDVPGLLTASAGLFALVYGFSNAQTQSWTATVTIITLVASPALLISFVVIESRVKNPLLPLHIVRNRARGGAYISVLLASAGVFGVFFFLTYYMQLTLRFSPLTAGLAFLPMTGLLVATSVTAQTRVLPRTGAKPLVMTGMTLGVIAMIVFTRLTPGGAYATHVLPGLVVIGIGMGCIFAPAIGTATLGVEVRETGVASAMVNTSQQVGGAVGLALLSTLSASAVADYARTHPGLPGLAGAAAVHGYTTGFWWAAGIFAIGLLLALLILPSKAEARECTPRTALARGIAYALHLEAAAAAAATHSLRVSTRPPTRAGSSPDQGGSSDRGDTSPNPSP